VLKGVELGLELVNARGQLLQQIKEGGRGEKERDSHTINCVLENQ
jgi:hypothetical protein